MHTGEHPVQWKHSRRLGLRRASPSPLVSCFAGATFLSNFVRYFGFDCHGFDKSRIQAKSLSENRIIRCT